MEYVLTAPTSTTTLDSSIGDVALCRYSSRALTFNPVSPPHPHQDAAVHLLATLQPHTYYQPNLPVLPTERSMSVPTNGATVGGKLLCYSHRYCLHNMRLPAYLRHNGVKQGVKTHHAILLDCSGSTVNCERNQNHIPPSHEHYNNYGLPRRSINVPSTNA